MTDLKKLLEVIEAAEERIGYVNGKWESQEHINEFLRLKSHISKTLNPILMKALLNELVASREMRDFHYSESSNSVDNYDKARKTTDAILKGDT